MVWTCARAGRGIPHAVVLHRPESACRSFRLGRPALVSERADVALLFGDVDVHVVVVVGVLPRGGEVR